ncbi:hypothetical protein HYPBUDRAFT_150175 [Hyphopichia burtonii NRRL Y-1933]|uniref:Uncharacterized protein n=1 Tax=Hyphopichia burtonii NRRL Y-1933 TaxID=984485 RepID=A0A1E4RE70_9ASCO|nr:hypothetical protein HYPBUDRAFT_150175 [Hyphopichia burtonii NRRL Y-1933]ODV65533.1 hypothetical protein HYPBUDRAFT_150175 [Hyphopichia burtonii NRRL Y-1933]
MSILISGLNKLNITKSNNKNELDQPSNGELIKKLNYEELEKNYEIHKYYPQFIHNQGISTPTIKELIIDKPIYSKANEHIEGWKNPGTRKALITELDIETGELKRYEQPDKDQRKDRREERRERREERREDRKDRREERREDRKDRREDRRERREDRREDRHERREELREHRHERREELREHRHERKEVRRRRKREPHGLFTNQLTMPSVYERYRSSSEESLRLARNQTSYSYDATKSNMTNKRSNKWKFKFNERRLSEQLGMYSYLIHVMTSFRTMQKKQNKQERKWRGTRASCGVHSEKAGKRCAP